MTREEVGVQMSLQDPLDTKALRAGFLEVHPDVAPRIDARRVVSSPIR
jgi:hypothetical protein